MHLLFAFNTVQSGQGVGNEFFYIIAGGAFVSWLLCIMWLKEPESGFADEYQVSSVDLQIEEEERRRQAAATS